MAYGLGEVLDVASAIIRKFGYVSGKAVYEGRESVSTADRVASQMSSHAESRPLQESDFTDETHELAQKALSWVKTLSKDGDDYTRNLALIAENDWVSGKSLGLAVSAISAYGRHLAKAQTEADAAVSQYVGQPGDKIVTKVTVLGVISNESTYGVTGIHTLRDDSGNVLVWFASASAGWLKAGDTVTVKATVKAHTTFRGVKQTTLLRVKAVEQVKPA